MSEYSANHILLIDDDSHIELKEHLEAVYPNSKISAFSELENAITFISECTESERPDAIITDCTGGAGSYGDMGVRNGRAIAEWYQANTGALPNATVIFISKDVHTAKEVADKLKDEIGLEAIAGNTHEFDEYAEVAQGDTVRFLWPDDKNGFRDFINRTAGLNLPVTQDDVDAALIANENYRPEDLVRMMKDGKFDVVEGLKIIKPHLREAIDKNYALDVETRRLPEGIFPEDTETEFSEGVGQPVTGYAAYSVDDIKALATEGKKAVFIMDQYTPDFIPQLKHVSGVVMISSEGTGHLKMLLASHGISGVFGIGEPVDFEDEWRMENTRVVFDGVLKAHRKLNPIGSMGDMQRSQARTEELYPDYGRYMRDEIEEFDFDQIDRELTQNIHTDISAGTPITIDPTGSYKKKLYGVHLPIKEQSYRFDRWVDDTKDLLAEWKKANGIHTPAFKANIDNADQMQQAIELAEGVGLVRTEHMVLTSESQIAAYKRAVLEQDQSAFADLTALQAADFGRMLAALDFDFPIKIRLIDAPPSEFFSTEEKSRFAMLYGDEGIRGVQLAEQIPELYKSQIDAIFSGLQEARKSTWSQGGEIPGASGPVEIMVPTVRTADELTFVLSLVRSSAQEHGFNQTDYRFGTMLETLDACDNIEAIAQHCDFISIGSNDLTSEALKCSRDDWERRRELTVASGKGTDPFVTLHDDVLALMFNAVSKARTVKSRVDIDLCGEHAADEATLTKTEPLKLSSVSMRPIAQNIHGLRVLSDYAIFTDRVRDGISPKANIDQHYTHS